MNSHIGSTQLRQGCQGHTYVNRPCHAQTDRAHLRVRARFPLRDRIQTRSCSEARETCSHASAVAPPPSADLAPPRCRPQKMMRGRAQSKGCQNCYQPKM